MRKLKFNNISMYHVYNRGVEKRDIFLDKQDHYRFVHDLYEFNDTNPTPNIYYRTNQNKIKSYEAKPHKIKKRELLVEIYAFCLMPNHFHLFLKQLRDNGISTFLHKLGTGYSMYFNQKYKRNGSLFQGPFKAVWIEKEAHFIHLPYYIHLNPLSLIEPKWKQGKIKNFGKTVEFLETYRWSSYLDYTGKKNFPSIIQDKFLSEFFGSPQKHKKETLNWLKEINPENIIELF